MTLIDRRNHHLFQPLLYQVATAALSPSDVAEPVRGVFRGADNIRVLMDEVTEIAADDRVVRTRTRHIPYDVLVLAPGSADDYFGHDEWSRHVLGLKSLADAVAIRHRILEAFERAEVETDSETQRRLMTVVVIGGGPTGVELAGALAELAKYVMARDYREIDPATARVVLLEGGPTLLSGFPPRLQEFAARALRRAGVEVRLETMAEEIDAAGVAAGGARFDAETVIWAAGQKVRSPLADWLGVESDKAGRIAVGPELHLVSRPEVFVLGDAAFCPGADGKPLPALAAVAVQQGAYVGRLLRRRFTGEDPLPPFRYKDRGTLATIGRSAAVADFGFMRLAGRLAWWLWGAVHIYSLIGFRNRASVMLNWLWSYFTLRPGARLIIPRR